MMGKTAFGLALATAMAVGLGSAAEAKSGAQVGAGNTGSVNVSGKVHINQNDNGCRNRCYGEQTYNAGFNNGNSVVFKPPGQHPGYGPKHPDKHAGWGMP